MMSLDSRVELFLHTLRCEGKAASKGGVAGAGTASLSRRRIPEGLLDNFDLRVEFQ